MNMNITRAKTSSIMGDRVGEERKKIRGEEKLFLSALQTT
jgi:hypothetical protein